MFCKHARPHILHGLEKRTVTSWDAPWDQHMNRWQHALMWLAGMQHEPSSDSDLALPTHLLPTSLDVAVMLMTLNGVGPR